MDQDNASQDSETKESKDAKQLLYKYQSPDDEFAELLLNLTEPCGCGIGSSDDSDEDAVSKKGFLNLTDTGGHGITMLRDKVQTKIPIVQATFLPDENHELYHGPTDGLDLRHFSSAMNAADLKNSQMQQESIVTTDAIASDASRTIAANISPRVLGAQRQDPHQKQSQDPVLAVFEAEKQRLRQALCSFERVFWLEHGRFVSSMEDIQSMAVQYHQYKQIKKAIHAYMNR